MFDFEIGKKNHFNACFVVLIIATNVCCISCLTGCQSGGLSIGPRNGIFGIPIEFSKREEKPKQSIDEVYENLLAENGSPATNDRLDGESINWFDAQDAPSADEWFAGTTTLAETSTDGSLFGQNTPRSSERPTDRKPQSEIMQASYSPRDVHANDVQSQGITNAAMTPNSTANQSGVTPAYRSETTLPTPLAQDVWVTNLELERFRDGKTDRRSESPWRWRHRGIEEILILPTERQPNWQASLQHDDPIVRGNVLITLARRGDQRVGDGLVDLINDVSQSRPMRCAAVEALGSLESTRPETLLQLAETYYDYVDANGNRKSGIPELAVETLHALAAKMPIANEPHFTRPLESRDAKVRLAAVGVWRDKAPNLPGVDDMPMQQQSRTTLPEIIVHYCGDSNPVMQEAALATIARWRHPRAMQCLDLGLRSPKATVRCAAIHGLAELRTNEATALLLSQVNDPSTAIRAEVVIAMGRLGLLDNVFRMSDDPGWEVRKAVAKELAKSDDSRTRTIAQKYLRDPSTQVQTATLESLRQWHPESAAPLVFEAMGGGSLETRNLATEMLAEYWEPARQYIPNARTTEMRRQQYDQLTAQFQRDMQTGTLQAGITRALNGETSPQMQANMSSSQAEPPRRIQINEQQHATAQQTTVPNAARADDGQVRALLTQLQQPGSQQQHQNAAAELVDLGPSVLPVLEQIAVGEGRPLPPVVYRQMLPGLDSLFGISAKLENNDPGLRRAAVAELVGETKFSDVSPLLYKQLADHAIRENDEIVLQRLWDFVDLHAEKLARLDVEWQGNMSPDMGQRQYQKMLVHTLATFRRTLTATSTAHASPEPHRRACRHLKEHGQPEDVSTLLAEINHPSTSVSRTALQALAKLGGIEHAAKVRPLLTHPQPLVAVDAALTLDRWGDSAGTNALERLTVSGDRTTKLAVVQGIKNSLDRKYVPLLIRLLDESGTIRQEALDALPLAAGRDVVPPQEMAYFSAQERVALWKQWNDGGQVF